MVQNLGKFWSINWSYFGPNMGNIYCCANYGQNMDHKLVIKWAKSDHRKVGAKYGQSMVHKMGKIWARFGPISDKVLCIGFVGVLCVLCYGVYYVYLVYLWLYWSQ